MITRSSLITLLALLPTFVFAQSTNFTPAPTPSTVRYEIPMLDVTTTSAGGKAETSTVTNTLPGSTTGHQMTSSVTTTSSQHALTVGGKVRFFKIPPKDYYVLCFFLQKTSGEGASANYKVAMDKARGTGQETAFSFTSDTLTTISGQSSRTGNSFAGWIVAVIMDGQVLRSQSSRPELDAFARANPSLFPLDIVDDSQSSPAQ